MSRRYSSDWAVDDDISADRLQDINQELDDLFIYGNDRGRVRTAISGTPLRIDIAAFSWRVGATSGQYAGGTDITVVDTATNYVEIDSTGTIVINQVGWTATNGRLATVTCAGGVVTAISIWKVDAIGGQLGGSALFNAETLSGNRTLLSSDKVHQKLNPGGANRDVVLDTTNQQEGGYFEIKNAGVDFVLTIKQSTTVIGKLDVGDEAYVIFDGLNWYVKHIVRSGIGDMTPFYGLYTRIPSGTLLCAGGTVGNGSSGGTLRANADMEAIFTWLWNTTANTELVIQDSSGSNTTRGASAAADFAANKRMPVPDMRAQVPGGLDNMGGSSRNKVVATEADTMGDEFGAETHTLTIAQLAAHNHDFNQTIRYFGSSGAGIPDINVSDSDGSTLTIQNKGNDNAHNNMQPTTFMCFYIHTGVFF